MSSCRSIETLLLQGCKGLTNDALSAFVPALDDAPVHANLTKQEHTDKKISVIGRRRLSHMLFDLDTASKVEHGDQHSRLVHLDISLCRHFDDRALEMLSRSCGWLEEIRLDEASKISDAGILNLVTFCANLRFVSLNRCVKVTDDCITHLVEHCPYLAELNLWCCSNITDAALFTLGGVKYPSYEKMESKMDVSASNLRSLNLKLCPLISDDGIIALSRGCPKLTTVRLQRGNISDAGILSLTSNCKMLRTIEIGALPSLTDSAMNQIAEYCKELTSFTLFNCDRVSFAGLRFVLRGCLALENVELWGCAKIPTEIKSVPDALSALVRSRELLEENEGDAIARIGEHFRSKRAECEKTKSTNHKKNRRQSKRLNRLSSTHALLSRRGGH